MTIKRKRRGTFDDNLVGVVGIVFIVFLTIGFMVLTVNHIKEYVASKTFETATARVVGDVDINKITKEDKYGNIESVTKYYTYDYVFTVDGEDYYGNVFNIEKYYGDSFEVKYDKNDPSHFIIGDEAKPPVTMCIVLILLIGLSCFTVYRVISDW